MLLLFVNIFKKIFLKFFRTFFGLFLILQNKKPLKQAVFYENKEINDISPLTGIALELEKLNQMLVAEKIRRKSLHKKIITAGAIVILVILIIAVYPQWNQMFYEFGRNLYGCVG